MDREIEVKKIADRARIETGFIDEEGGRYYGLVSELGLKCFAETEEEAIAITRQALAEHLEIYPSIIEKVKSGMIRL